MYPEIISDRDKVLAVFDSLDVRESTIREYKYRIRHFLAFTELNDFDYNSLVEYKRMLQNHPTYSASTKSKYLMTAKIFLSRCYALRYLPVDMGSGVKSFQISKEHKKSGLTESEMDRLLGWMNNHPEKLRERALLCLLIFQGFRQAEVCSLQLHNVVFKERVMFVRGKGRDDLERVPMHEQVYTALLAYTGSRQEQFTLANDYLFKSERKQGSDGALTTRGLRSIVKTIFAELDIDKSVHALRHYFATKLVRNMPNLLEAARWTRHRSTEMLKVYTDELGDDENISNFHNAFSDVSARLTS
ncbi:MAG: tyrosine-type recombinase/integrase [Candidatus Saccharimonadales bacterium]